VASAIGHGTKTDQGVKLVVRATLIGHISKEVWVAKAIAGGELFVGSTSIRIVKI
jgi:hypothetical protein